MGVLIVIYCIHDNIDQTKVIKKRSSKKGGMGVEFDLNAAKWRSGATNEKAMIEALATRIEQALPGKARVVREKSLFAKEAHVSRIEIPLDEHTYVLEFSVKKGLHTEKSKTVRGIRLKTEMLHFEKWLEHLSQDLQILAENSENDRCNLEKFLLS